MAFLQETNVDQGAAKFVAVSTLCITCVDEGAAKTVAVISDMTGQVQSNMTAYVKQLNTATLDESGL